ncbi:unnamed protein product [Haemonchus placei]|uniref:PID domain-containing protein n=1 Tax=Haemonchus placei TaxID=6290 RepID=A0A158QQE8_HAEPC|nr:unnamed protein product [Haemonchus placei]
MSPPGTMPFFANPFMSPFMPQQGVPMDAGANPAMPAFFFSPAQYQEMMQQYFTQMMTANQYGMNMAFPMPFGTTLVRPCSQISPTSVQFRDHHNSSTFQGKSPCVDSSSEKVSTKSEGEEKKFERKSSLPTEDEKTSNLIRKQMSEIEKEITRRSQNKNIKKVGPLLTSLLFLRNLNHIENFVYISGRGSEMTGWWRNTVLAFNFLIVRLLIQAYFLLQLAAAFLPQDQRPTNVPSGGTIAPPPPPSAQPSSSSEWPDENKENGSTEEPVWVLRDSYLKRMHQSAFLFIECCSKEQRDEWNGDANTAASASSTTETPADGEEMETDRLLLSGSTGGSQPPPPSTGHGKKKNSKETMVHEPAVLIEGVLFRARYLGSTQMMCESRGSKAARMAQAQEAVARVKAPEGEIQPSTEIDLFISTEKIMVLNTDLQRISDTDVRQDILMDHALRTISYIADIGDLVVLMARRMSASSSDEQCNQVDGIKKTPKVICHVFESDEASFIAQSIGQAFQVGFYFYERTVLTIHLLNSQELLGDELEMFARKETQKDVVVPKKSGEPLGIVVVESGWGSMLPTVVLAHMNPAGPAARSNQLNIGDQIININGISLVGLPLSAAQTNIKNVKTCTAVRLTVVSTPPVVEVRIRRPDTKYQLGFSVQNGVICSLLRGGIAERGGIRVGHRIIEINNQSVVAVAHDRIVNMLATAIGEIHMKTMPTSMFRLLTGQDTPQYI